MSKISFYLYLCVLVTVAVPSEAGFGRSKNIKYMTMHQLKQHINNFANYKIGSNTNLVQELYRTSLKQATQSYLREKCSLTHVYAYSKRQENRIVLFCKSKNSKEASSIEVYFTYRQDEYKISLVTLRKGFLPRSNGRPGVSMGTR